MGEYKAEDYVWFIETGRMDKISTHGMELIAKRFRELEAQAEDKPIIIETCDKETQNGRSWIGKYKFWE